MLELRSIDEARNRRRVYRLTEVLTLFERELVIEWGREGRPLRRRVEVFPTPAALEARRGELLARRRRHGYRSR